MEFFLTGDLNTKKKSEIIPAQLLTAAGLDVCICSSLPPPPGAVFFW